MAYIKQELTPEYLTYKAIEGFNGANRVYIPLGGNGLPLVGTLDLNTGAGVLPELPKE